MPARRLLSLFAVGLFAAALAASAQDYARDPHQAIDESYTAAIRKYTTQPEFNSSLTDYLPASSKVPTPANILGDVSGAPDKRWSDDQLGALKSVAGSNFEVVAMGDVTTG